MSNFSSFKLIVQSICLSKWSKMPRHLTFATMVCSLKQEKAVQGEHKAWHRSIGTEIREEVNRRGKEEWMKKKTQSKVHTIFNLSLETKCGHLNMDYCYLFEIIRQCEYGCMSTHKFTFGRAIISLLFFVRISVIATSPINIRKAKNYARCQRDTSNTPTG